jgi:hypothetical protein
VARVVLVHGIGSQYSGPQQMAGDWVPALLDGLGLAGAGARLDPADVGCAFYGDLFRPAERILGGDVPLYTAHDVDNEYEVELLAAWWSAAAQADPGVAPPDERVLSLITAVQAALAALAGSRYFAGLADRVMIYFLKQVHRYFAEPGLRDKILDRFAAAVGPDTRIVVAHSLGSVVAYEALCAAAPNWRVNTFVTLGSPLGVPRLIYDRLTPVPSWVGSTRRGLWPPTVRSWTNLADRVDFVALVKRLAPLFGAGDQIKDVQIDNGVHVHEVARYLTARAAGAAVAAGLNG